ncbi:unnamed protein product, partial [Pleuronectes platessa]
EQASRTQSPRMPQVPLFLKKPEHRELSLPGFLNFTQRCEKLPIGHSGPRTCAASLFPSIARGGAWLLQLTSSLPIQREECKGAASSSSHRGNLLVLQALPNSELRLDVLQENSKRHLRCTAQQNR